MHREGGDAERSSCCSTVAVIFSGIFWLSAAVLGILVDTNGQCFNSLRFAIFRNKSDVIYQSWSTDITPPSWAFSAWEYLYTWNMLWVVYCLATICRTGEFLLCANQVKQNPDGEQGSIINIFPARLHVAWSSCSITHVAWLLLWDREAFVAALFVQGFVIASCVACLVTSHRQTYRCGALLQYKHPWDLWVARTLTQNGVAMLAAWNLFLLIINVVILLVHHGGLPMHVTSAVAYGTFGLLTLVWFIVETFFLDQWLRYSFAVYAAVAWTACGVLARDFNLQAPVTIAALTVCGVASLVLIIRVPLVVWRSYSYPLYVQQTMRKIDQDLRQRDDGITTIF